MNVNPGTTPAALTGDQDTAPHSQDEGEQISDNATFVSKAPAENMVGGQITEGVPVMDSHGETIGNVAAYNEGDGNIVVRGGWLFDQDTQLPLDLVGDRGASGLYLTQSKDELMQQYGGGGGATAGTANTNSGATDQSTMTGDTNTMGAMDTTARGMDQPSTTGDTMDASSQGKGTDSSTMATDTSGISMSGATDAADMGKGATDMGTDTASTQPKPTASMQQPTSGDAMGTSSGDDRVIVRDDSKEGLLRDKGTTNG